MTTAVSLAAVAKPPDLETKYLQVIDARRALDNAIEEQKAKRQVAEFELAEIFAQEISTTPNLNIAEAAFQRYEAWRVADERAEQWVGALESIRQKVCNNIDRLKTESSDAVTSVLNKKLETLKKALKEEEVSTQSIKSEIKNLEQEIKKTPNPAPKKS